MWQGQEAAFRNELFVMFSVVKNFISKEDVSIVNDYISTIDFNTKDSHVELHNDLYENRGAMFDIHTRGEMPKHVLDIFSKYSKGFYEAVQDTEVEEYHPPMFSKHYIARYHAGASVGPQYDPGKPEGTYKSYIYWNSNFSGGEFGIESDGEFFVPEPGDLVFFPENKDNLHIIKKISDGYLFLSEAWMGRVGQAWMDNVDYEATNWNDWEIKGF